MGIVIAVCIAKDMEHSNMTMRLLMRTDVLLGSMDKWNSGSC